MNQDQDNKPRSRLASWLGWLGAFLLSIFGKLKSLLPLLKFGKFGGTLISMIISVGGYALLFPFKFAVGLVLMIFIHEMGHVWAAKIKGLPVSAPAFIPFLGALITMKKQPQDAVTEAYIAYGGPLIGTLGALVSYGIGVWTKQEIYYVIAMIGFFINLFNLIPIHPLDGGRIVTAISRWLWALGLVIGLIAIIYLRSFLLAFIYLLFVWELWLSYGKRKKKMKPRKFSLQTEVELERFEVSRLSVPGEEHRRPLPFTQYCLIENQEHFLEIEYPGVGTIMKMEGVTGVVHEVQLKKTFRSAMQNSRVQMVLEGTYTPPEVGTLRKDEKYYRVPVKTRWAFSLAYIGLVGFLVYMLFIFGNFSILNPPVS